MNAKERLRAYLEQRRELGESEMVLDALDVDDVMRMLGALPGGAASAPDGTATEVVRAPRSTPAPPPTPRDTPRADVPPPVERVYEERSAPNAAPVSDDWREVMRNLQGGSASRPPETPTPPASADVPAAAAGMPTRPPRTGTLRVEGIVVPLGLRVERPSVLGSAVAGSDWHTLRDVDAAIAACKACGLVQSATRPVPGIGNPDAEVLVVGEAPGEQEDLRGEPFVGPAGDLLTKILGAIQLTRESVYICNVLKHRPPGNRNPLPDEVRACAPFLQRQIDLVQPTLILAFGTFAAQSLLGTKLAIGKLRQQLHWYQGIPLVATYHPAALLRNDAWKRPTWEDVKLARRVLDATVRS
jgi:uracil-DNA glycosylase